METLTAILEFVKKYYLELGTLATFLLVALNVLLWIATNTAAQAAKSAAKSAKKSASALVAVERARFFVVIEADNFHPLMADVALNDNSPAIMVDEPFVRFCFKNYGKTPGTIEEVALGNIVVAPELGVREFTVKPFRLAESMIGAGATTAIAIHKGARLPVRDVLPVMRGEASLWFHGHMVYRDVFGSLPTHKFVFKFHKTDDGYMLQLHRYT